MNSHDRRLGMDRAISRRDFLNGISVAIGASLLPACGRDGEPIAELPAAYYPPAETGMRGSHAGSFEVAHATLQGRQWPAEKTGEHYDLAVVGAGISGLSAAYLYHRDVDPNARILILDNHDDFGGHAKRNEFTLDGRTFIGYGGTMLIEAPKTYPNVAMQVIRELGIDTDRHSEFYHEDLFKKHGAGRVSFFDKETFGADYLATGQWDLGASINDAPLSASAKAELERLLADEDDYLPGMTPEERRAVLESHSWRDYLEKYGKFGDEVLAFVQKWPHGVWAIGADALPAWMAWLEEYPGFAGMDIGHEKNEYDDGGFYFPDGNASIARLLVRKLIPDIAPGNSMEDIVTARFDYSTLDQPENLTRIRLSSTVVGLKHQDGKLDAEVDITYVRDGQGRTITANKVVWAGYHSMLPFVCPDVPEEQTTALKSSVRAPLVYTNVLIKNWRSLANVGMRRAYCPGSFFQTVMPTHPVSIGDYRFSTSPDEPLILHMNHVPLSPGLPASQQFRAGQRALHEITFETFERNVRDQLGRMLGPGGFDPASDIAGITVNRWPHGYAYSIDKDSGDVAWWPNWWRHERRPWVDARQRVGNIAFANTDAASNAMTESAIEEAHRAVHSLRKETS
ncbi:MAG: NAD(P)-binding protein [Woeseiaceae bacterium]|nr:NAD(P)-binding protein [Woeseiaceae bacterium]NIP20310.1 NAD(P)-binding protein [Woeseiaceae bacterium]NIS89127.1 NAD(P)-binding protein [Woeseiaceae bacterium]